MDKLEPCKTCSCNNSDHAEAVLLSDVKGVLHDWFKIGELTVYQYSNIVAEIKKKAGL